MHKVLSIKKSIVQLILHYALFYFSFVMSMTYLNFTIPSFTL